MMRRGGELAHQAATRWPTTEHDPGPLEHPPAPRPGQHSPEDLYNAMGDLAAAIASMVPVVLSSETWILNAAGQATREYHLPFRSIAVWSYSAQRLTVANAPIQSGPPTNGAGVAIVPINGFKLSNIAGLCWSIYGGTQGDIVCVETYGVPMPPTAAKMV